MTKNFPGRIILLLAFLATSLMFACTKSYAPKAAGFADQAFIVTHKYGLLPMEPAEWSKVPVFSNSLFTANGTNNALAAPNPLPNSWILNTPQVRDQGQIGSCTGFCGTEALEILYYYKKNSIAPITNIGTSIGADTAWKSEIPNTSDEPAYNGGVQSYTNVGLGSNAFSPLFLYFVERVVINKGTIASDPGANMVNICQALQGLSNNSGSGVPLTYNSWNFVGIPNEIQYTYPFVLGTGGYNAATSSSSPYQVYPYNFWNYAATPTTIPAAPYRDSIGSQNGGTSSSNGITNHGYYAIISSSTQRITDVKTAIANNKPIMMGFNIYDNTKTYQYFEGLNTTSYTYNPLTTSGGLKSGLRLLGGHAVPIVGYINDSSQPGGGVFVCENSWGTPWGYHGYFYLPYAVLQSTSIVPSGNLYVAIL